jgi:hypothetical protein
MINRDINFDKETMEKAKEWYDGVKHINTSPMTSPLVKEQEEGTKENYVLHCIKGARGFLFEKEYIKADKMLHSAQMEIEKQEKSDE